MSGPNRGPTNRIVRCVESWTRDIPRTTPRSGCRRAGRSPPPRRPSARTRRETSLHAPSGADPHRTGSPRPGRDRGRRRIPPMSRQGTSGLASRSSVERRLTASPIIPSCRTTPSCRKGVVEKGQEVQPGYIAFDAGNGIKDVVEVKAIPGRHRPSRRG